MSLKCLSLWCLVLAAVIVCDGVEKGMAMPVKSRDKRSDDSGPLEAVVEKLIQQVTLLNAQVSSLNAKDSNQDSEIAAMKTKADTVVAFHAWNNVNPIQTTMHGTLIFDHAETNVGNAYSTRTGVFTAAVSGLYHFQTTFLVAHVGNGGIADAAIYVDSKMVARGVSDTRHGAWDQATISSVVHVSAGQQVFVKNPNDVAHEYFGSANDPVTTFSGFLLRAD